MNIHKKCRRCHEFFPAKPMDFKFVCDKKKCQKYFNEYHFHTIKSNRALTMDYFDIYDLEKPIVRYSPNVRDDIVVGYERVCRQCGEPLFNKDGKYSPHRRYCGNHTGYELWSKYNWGEVSKDYAREIRDDNEDLIEEKFNEIIQKKYALDKEIPEWVRETNNLTICEECKKICQIYSSTFLYNRLKIKVINIHHKTPVHILTIDNLHLIWEFDNLIALCEDCHHKQNHQLKTKIDPYTKFKKIIELIEVD